MQRLCPAFPIDWPEPFGLVLIEAMACGTPVIAFGRGSVPEVIEEGVTGFVVDNVEEAVAALSKVQQLDRLHCRRAFEKRFFVTRMTEDYLQIYRRVVEGQRKINKDGNGADDLYSIGEFVSSTSNGNGTR